MQMPQEYIIAGATGLVGSEVVTQLLASADTGTIWLLGRKPVDSADQRVKNIRYNFTGEPVFSGKPQSPIAICTLGTTIKQAGSQAEFRRVDFDFVLRFAEVAKALGAPSLHVVTAHGSAAGSRIFYNRVKGEIEEALRNVGIASVHVYRPSLLIGERKEHRAGEGFASAAAKVMSPLFKLPGLNAVQPTPAKHLAAFMLQTAAHAAAGYHIHANVEIMAGA